MYTNTQQPSVTGKAGFTLVELLMVVALLGILAIMSIPVFSDYITKTRTKRCIGDIRTIDKAIVSYILERNSLPASLTDVGMDTQMDPWGRPYRYQNLSLGGTPLEDSFTNQLNQDYDLYSEGKDGLSSDDGSNPTSADDIVRANNGIYAGERS